MLRLIFFSAFFTVSALQETPVQKVARLLTEMKDQLAADAKSDEELYEKMGCFCATNKKDKSDAVSMAEKSITSLKGKIEELTAKSAELSSAITRLGGEIAKAEGALSQATSIREKENGEFSDSEKELMESLASCTAAIETLSGQQAFLQVSEKHREAVHMKLKAVVLKHKDVLAPSQRRAMLSFLQGPMGNKSYNSRSGDIFGILEQMKETFTTSLNSERSEEATAVSDFEALKAGKMKEINARKEQVMDKTAALSTAKEELAHSKHELGMTKKQLSADEAFLVDLGDRCANADKEYAERTKMRATEIAAVSEAMSIVMDDSARDLFADTYGVFTQTRARQNGARAANVLANVAKKTKSAALLELSNKARRDSFTKVTEMIDTMVADLKKEQEDEYKHQEFCAKELSENEQQQTDTKDHISDLTSEIEESTDKVNTLASEIAELQKQIAEMNVQLKRAGEDRVLANEEFQRTIQDQRATQLILNKVMKRLEKVYEAPPPPEANATNATEGEAPAAFLQRGLAHHKELHHKQMPSFGAYGKNDEGGGVVGLIAEIIREASSLEAEATVAEQGAQNDYQAFVSETAKSIAAANRSISAKSDEKADLEEAIVAAKSDRADSTKKLMDLGKYEMQLHTSCDYVMQNFEMRQTARQEEMDGLAQAKSILHGS
jgi:septal ring factor EnvC (AmiA/AmiB activator)